MDVRTIAMKASNASPVLDVNITADLASVEVMHDGQQLDIGKSDVVAVQDVMHKQLGV